MGIIINKMIDTIVLRIHDVKPKYQNIANYLKSLNTKDYVSKFKTSPDAHLSETNIFFSDTARILSLSHRSSISLPSSHYSVSFQINDERDFIEFNFSIPKLLYGNNVMQFIDIHSQSKDFVFSMFQSSIHHFLNTYLPYSPSWLDIEVNRIDLCYNQFFNSKNEALKYLGEQKKINIDYARSDTNRFMDYNGTAVMYKTDNYSFKIYHKGTEFRKNDLPKMAKSFDARLKKDDYGNDLQTTKNNPLGLNLFDLAETADKILRYEITCRSGLLNYIFKQHLKDEESTVFNHHYMKIFKLGNQKRNKFINSVKSSRYMSSDNPTEIFINKTLPNKKFQFRLDSLWDRMESDSYSLMDNYNLLFSRELFICLHDFFWERVKKYQLGAKLSYADIMEKISEYKDKQEKLNNTFTDTKTINYTASMLMIATLSQYTDVTEMKEYLPKSTYYRYMDMLKKLGIPKYSADIALIPPDLNYDTYFHYFGKYHLKYLAIA